MLAVIVLLAAFACVVLAAGIGMLLLADEQAPDASPPDSSSDSTSGSSPSAAGGKWQKAYATVYNSFAKCCKDSPTYDPDASTTECDKNNACRYTGTFAALGRKPYEWVRDNNIVAAFKVGQTDASWRRDFANRKVRLRNAKTGATLDAVVGDTCGDHDCDDCCTENASRGGGMLIDLEAHTARRFYAPDRVEGAGKIEWQFI